MATRRGPVGTFFGTGIRRVPVPFGPAAGPGVWTMTPPGGAAADHGSLGSSGSEPICPSGAPAGTKLGSAAGPRTGPSLSSPSWIPVRAVFPTTTIAARTAATATAAGKARLTRALSGHDDLSDPLDP